MKKTVIILTALILTFWTVAGAWTAEQYKVKSEAGRFSITSPVTLQESVQSLEHPDLGKVDMHAFLGQKGDTTYGVIYNDLSEALVRNPQERLDKIRDGAVKNVNGKLTRENRIALTGFPGRELVIDFVPKTGKAVTLKERIYLVKNRLYQIKCIAVRDKANIAEIDDFLKSFNLLK